ncbi:LPS-assembly protein LptD [Sulfurimonas lithotrophica]|uniref:LPS-assembly protein LptD n=1 Tax=Sulfurimonas lithotrophica TaxID=2590022 RepID=A0A5P8P2D6_9BACT|nr:LPS assembly protein LptD [Sulfurimonas lithotrophica]QFR49869.1 LPS-assembly protein LptD [Sulfurimonas lithotrophica]
MFKFFLFLLVFTTLLFSNEKVEIFANDIYTEDEILYADGEVNVVYKDYYLSAKRAKYHKLNGNLELFENVKVTQNNNYKILGEYIRIDIKNKQKEFKPFYLLDEFTKVWMSAKNGSEKEEDIIVKSGVLSGCNPINPLWKIEFSSSDYNEQTKWLNTYNNRLYIYDIPVFYTPYFGVSLDKTRRSGLLYPILGISNDEGFYYEQPIFIAEQNWWDLELKPQIRTKRGRGIYSEFRFVDSKVSEGSLTFGHFREKESYYEEENLANKEHNGADLKYYNLSFLNEWFGLDFKGQSSIYADIHYMNDVDYINLSSSDSTTNATAQQVLSRVNMFYNNEDDYYGSYLKYYQDLTLEDNGKTLQQLPTLHYHHYLQTFFDNHLLYNLDMQSTNIYRRDGVGVVQTDVNIPITLQTSIFDEYVNIAYKTYIYAQFSNFTGLDEIDNPDDYRDGHYAKNYNVVQIGSSLTKAFSEYTHVIDFETKYTFSGAKSKKGYYEDYKNSCLENNTGLCEFYNVNDSTKALNFEFSQYLYDTSGNEKLYHKLAQNIVYNDDNSESDKEYGELENELNYQITESFNFYNNTLYNHDEHGFSKIYNKIIYKNNSFNISLSHLFKDHFHKEGEEDTPSNPAYTRYLTSTLSYKYDEHYSYNIGYNYDINTNLKKKLEIGFLYQKRCWDFGLKYLENNRPILTNNDVSSIYDRYVYFTILFKPFMKSRNTDNFSYKLPDTYKGK